MNHSLILIVKDINKHFILAIYIISNKTSKDEGLLDRCMLKLEVLHGCEFESYESKCLISN